MASSISIFTTFPRNFHSIHTKNNSYTSNQVHLSLFHSQSNAPLTLISHSLINITVLCHPPATHFSLSLFLSPSLFPTTIPLSSESNFLQPKNSSTKSTCFTLSFQTHTATVYLAPLNFLNYAMLVSFLLSLIATHQNYALFFTTHSSRLSTRTQFPHSHNNSSAPKMLRHKLVFVVALSPSPFHSALMYPRKEVK